MIIFELFANPAFWFSILRATTPILFAALAALIAKRAGITNMAIEGIMTFSALFAVLFSYWSGSALVGFIVAVLIGTIVSLFLAFFKIKMKTDEVLVAIALNLLADGASIFILFLLTGTKSSSVALQSKMLPFIDIPIIQDIPFIGKIISGQNILVYFSFVAVAIMNFLLFKTPLGLRIRSVGSNPHAAESVGISVPKTQYIALLISGILSGIAGAFMSMGYMTMFSKGMIAGRGFIALAASNVGGVAPIGAMFASLLFGLFDALGNNLQMLSIPSEFIYMIPYFMTIVGYAFFSYRRMSEKQRKAKLALQAEGKE